MGGGGGSTTTTGIIPSELNPLYRGSANRLLGQQEGNQIGQYNAENPLNVEGANPMQGYGASLIGGGGAPSGLDALSLQSLLRMPGLAGAGPTTGQYDYGSEAGLGDMMSFLNPNMLQGEGLNNPLGPASRGFANVDPGIGDAPMSFEGLGDALKPPPSQGGGYGGGFKLPTDNQDVYTGGDDLQHPKLPPGYDSTNSWQGGPEGIGKSLGMGGKQPGNSIFAQQQAKYFGPGGAQGIMGDLGVSSSFSGDNGGMTTFSKGGKSYLNQGAEHEGGGQGGQSRFLQDIMGKEVGGSYTDVSKQDKALASIAQGNRLEQTKKFMAGQETPAQVAARKASAAGSKDLYKKKAK